VVPHIGKVKKIHTHIGPSDKSLFLHTAPSAKSTTPSPPLFYQEDATEKYQFSNYNSFVYLHLCVPFFNFRVSCSSDMQFCMTYLETCGSTLPFVAFSTLDFRSFFFVFGGTHTSPNSLTLHKAVSDFSDADSSVCTNWLIACYCYDRQWTELLS
jgi:hypothetical protein